MRLLIAAGSLFALLNIFFAIFLPEFGTELAYYEYSWRGITAFKNVCGYSTVFFIAPALFLKPKSSLHRAFLSGYVAAHILVLYFTKSRTAWLMLLGMVATRYVVRLSKKMEWRKYQSVLLSICMIASLALPVGQPIVAGIAAAIGKDPSLNGRTNVWASIAEALYKRPVLGYGFHAFWLGLAGESGKIMTSGRWYPGFAHNGFLEIWLELGIVGVVGMSVITVRNMIVGIRQLKVDYTEQNCWYICITVITVICNLAEGTLLSAANLSWMIFVIAWVGLANERKRSRHRTVVATSYQPTLVRRAV
jgi:O-antigen ligase